MSIESAIPEQIHNRDDFTLWAIEVSRHIVTEQGFELARAGREGKDDDLHAAGFNLGQTIVDTLLEVYDGLLDVEPDKETEANR